MQPVRTILVIKTGAIGDLIAGTTALRALRESFPGATITVVSNSFMKEICPPGTLVDDIIDLDPRTATPSAYLRIPRHLRRRRFDLAVNLRPASEISAFLTWISGAPSRLGGGPQSFRWMYT